MHPRRCKKIVGILMLYLELFAVQHNKSAKQVDPSYHQQRKDDIHRNWFKLKGRGGVDAIGSETNHISHASSYVVEIYIGPASESR